MAAKVSSAIANITFEPPDRMQVTFKSGHIHEYSKVSRLEYARFMAAPSKGTYYHQHIKGKYPSRKVGKVNK